MRRVFVTGSGPPATTRIHTISQLPAWEILDALPSNPRDRQLAIIVAPLPILTPLLRDHRGGPALLPYGPPDVIARAFLLGARDYLCTPFAPQELLARADRLNRRESLLSVEMGSVFEVAGESIVLRGVQREIFSLLARHEGGVVDRQAIQTVCGNSSESNGSSRGVDMAMSRLRRALQGYPVRIETVRGRGYRLVER
ncbi:MAG: winged helix-turn-helix domain-containing protein [Alkalispirochaeta sp.]